LARQRIDDGCERLGNLRRELAQWLGSIALDAGVLE
jgi:hypothetical protein